MLAGFALIIVATLFRLLPVFLGATVVQPEWLPNFSPMAALCLCGAACLPRRWAFAVPFTALLATDFILNTHYGFPLVNTELVLKNIAFIAIAAFGWQLRSRARAGVLLPATILSSLFFYAATNTASWLAEPAYAKNLAGLGQALTTGLPGYPATWTFYRNTFVSDLVFTCLFLLSLRLPLPVKSTEPVAVAS